MLEFAAAKGIKPKIETFKLSDINAAAERARSGKARYRVVSGAGPEGLDRGKGGLQRANGNGGAWRHLQPSVQQLPRGAPPPHPLCPLRPRCALRAPHPLPPHSLPPQLQVMETDAI